MFASPPKDKIYYKINYAYTEPVVRLNHHADGHHGGVVAGAEGGAEPNLSLDPGAHPADVGVDDVHGLAHVLVGQAGDQLGALSLQNLRGSVRLAQQRGDGLPHAALVELKHLPQLAHSEAQVGHGDLHLLHQVVHLAQPERLVLQLGRDGSGGLEAVHLVLQDLQPRDEGRQVDLGDLGLQQTGQSGEVHVGDLRVGQLLEVLRGLGGEKGDVLQLLQLDLVLEALNVVSYPLPGPPVSQLEDVVRAPLQLEVRVESEVLVAVRDHTGGLELHGAARDLQIISFLFDYCSLSSSLTSCRTG